VDVVPVLKQLLQIPYVNNQQCYQGHQADFFLERRALLELAIGRALARCGSAKGYEILINYLDDVRSLLSKQAHTELKRLSALNLHKDKEAWSNWIESQKDCLKPQPYLVHTDVGGNHETILRKITL
jgi:hypothetical protein